MDTRHWSVVADPRISFGGKTIRLFFFRISNTDGLRGRSCLFNSSRLIVALGRSFEGLKRARCFFFPILQAFEYLGWNLIGRTLDDVGVVDRSLESFHRTIDFT